jgi:hypothetical protein
VGDQYQPVPGPVLLPALTGCRPAAEPVVALADLDGRPTLLIMGCPDFRIDSVRVYPKSDYDRFQWTASTDSKPGPARLTLFEAPDGWTVTNRTLDKLTAGVPYTVSPYSEGRPAAAIHFTVDQVDKLGAGQVLMEEPGSASKVVSDEDFRKKAEESC